MQSNEEFGYPQFGRGKMECFGTLQENSYEDMPLTNTTNLYPGMLQNITVYRLDPGGVLPLEFPDQEMAIVLIEGHVQLEWENNYVNADRPNCIDAPAYCLHVCKGTPVQITSHMDGIAEVLVQSTENNREFPSILYTPETTQRQTFGQGQFEGKAQRTVSTFFDYASAPYSNMVCGEILIPQGGWSSYPPHEHPQPEVYYYRFGHPNGFGACFLDDKAYKIADRSFAAVPGGKYHPQVNAPGYPMMYVWMIRHFDGYPWTERNFQPEHQWLQEG